MKEKSKKSEKSEKPTTSDGKDGIWKDPRFAHLVSDPRFRNIHKSTKTVKIDKRFKSMFEDEKFKVKYTVDKYGRRVNQSSTDDLEKYYDIDSDEDEEEQRKEETELFKEGGNVDELHESDEEITEDIKTKLKDMTVDYARGEIPLLSDSSSDDESSSDENDEGLNIEHAWGDLESEQSDDDDDDNDGDVTTRRLALIKMDWDRIRSVDIMVLLNSFLPPGGSILSVRIYQSDYGKERMAEEEMKGPQELTENKVNSDNEYDSGDSEAVEENEEGDEYHMEKLRKYQLNRLKYYYAVVECDTNATADKIWHECNGLEYESTATKMKIKFIPDDMTFDNPMKDECIEMPDLIKYKPRLFTTTALQQAKVELTWDENDVEREELNEKLNTGKLGEIADSDLRKFVAYSSEEEGSDNDGEHIGGAISEHSEADENSGEEAAQTVVPSKKSHKKEDVISKYKNLLNEINQKEQEKKKNKVEMEFSWGIDTPSSATSKQDEIEKKTKDTDLNPFEKLIDKKREKKRARKEKIRNLKKEQNQSDSDDESEDDLPDGIDLKDLKDLMKCSYYAEEFANGGFAPAKPKKSKDKKKTTKKVENESDDEAQKDLELLLDDDDNKAHFSLKKIQERENETKTSKKRLKKLKNKKDKEEDKKVVEDDFKINPSDNRFSAIYSSHLFNIDPTDSHYRKTKAMETLIQEKLKRKASDTNGNAATDGAEPTEKKRRDVANSILVKSIKRKVQQKV